MVYTATKNPERGSMALRGKEDELFMKGVDLTVLKWDKIDS